MIIEHVMPAVNVGEQAHEEKADCWCKPTVMSAFEGTDHEHHVYKHNRPEPMVVGAAASKRGAPKKLATTRPVKKAAPRKAASTRVPAKKAAAKKAATKK